MILAAFIVGSAIGIAALLWRMTRHWWTRVLALPLAAYAGVQLQAVLAHHGSWALVNDVSARCVVRGGAPQDEVHLQAGNRAKAEEHLAALARICGTGCEEYRDLKKAIAGHGARAR